MVKVSNGWSVGISVQILISVEKINVDIFAVWQWRVVSPDYKHLIIEEFVLVDVLLKLFDEVRVRQFFRTIIIVLIDWQVFI